jgi:homocysteine S-methyltransferase
MADYALKFGAQGVKMLGGCCGSTPSHITALKTVLKDFEPPAANELPAENAVASINGDPAGRRERHNARRRERA